MEDILEHDDELTAEDRCDIEKDISPISYALSDLARIITAAVSAPFASALLLPAATAAVEPAVCHTILPFHIHISTPPTWAERLSVDTCPNPGLPGPHGRSSRLLSHQWVCRTCIPNILAFFHLVFQFRSETDLAKLRRAA